jgi:hypothetical protein
VARGGGQKIGVFSSTRGLGSCTVMMVMHHRVVTQWGRRCNRTRARCLLCAPDCNAHTLQDAYPEVAGGDWGSCGRRTHMVILPRSIHSLSAHLGEAHRPSGGSPRAGPIPKVRSAPMAAGWIGCMHVISPQGQLHIICGPTAPIPSRAQEMQGEARQERRAHQQPN